MKQRSMLALFITLILLSWTVAFGESSDPAAPTVTPISTPTETPTTTDTTATPTKPSETVVPPAPVVAQPEAKAVEFKDKKLEAQIRLVIKKKTEAITASDLEKLTVLKLAKKGLTNIEPLKNCKNLVELDVSGNPLKTVAPVVLCSKLKKLDLRGTGVKPQEMASLKNYLTGLSITSDPIEKMAKFTGMTTIYVYTLNSTGENVNLWAGENDKVPGSTLVEPGGMRYFWVTLKGYYMTAQDQAANKPVYLFGKVRVNMGKDGKVLYSKQVEIKQPYTTTLYFTWNGTDFVQK